jgi:hypothetical protein
MMFVAVPEAAPSWILSMIMLWVWTARMLYLAEVV